jgi:CheY-like chemotaxis protein
MATPPEGRRLVLAVDDDETVRELYEGQLPILGYDVACASGAAEARSALAARTPDLIIMDVMMRGQDGISLIRELRADPRTAHVPIVVVSGLTDSATLSDALVFGATDFITKPFELELLRAKLERAILIAEQRRRGVERKA